MRVLKILVPFAVASLLLGVASPLTAEYIKSSASIEATPQHKKSTRIITQVISRFHYKKQPLDDRLSEQMLERYIDVLDPNRSIFLQHDIDEFQRYKTRLDDYLLNGNVEPAFEIFAVYRKRVDEVVAYASSLLEGNFDFEKDESYRFDREDAPWSANQMEREQLWHKRVKNDWLGLHMADKEAEKIVETLNKRYAGLSRRVNQFKANDIFQMFINAYTISLEPHTSYMSPSTSENFDISMRLSLEGIGAVLRLESEYTTVQKTIAGGPAKLSGQVHTGDRILGVGQGVQGDVEDVIGWPLQDVVEKIRGPKDSVVRLQLQPKGSDSSQVKLVTLTRNKIRLEEQAANQSIIEGLDGLGNLRIGVIDVPTFYRDFSAQMQGDKEFRSTTRDVRKLIKELKAASIDGIVIDLRTNGGGSLSEATELTGLFINAGPVVQIKDALGRIEVERDVDPGVAYAGPLAVLVDRNSASASEIFAGAIQDYKRGIVIGEPTFGKGTVQTLVDLRRYAPDNTPNLGRLRLTMAQFFRINGGSTQHKGVVPDIIFPTAKYLSEHGERALENALPWAKIRPAKYQVALMGDMRELIENHKKRIIDNPGFVMLEAYESLLDKYESRQEVSLLESRRKAEWEDQEKLRLDYKNRFLVSVGLEPRKPDDKPPEHGGDVDEADELESNAIKHIELNEAARILVDAIRMHAPRSAMQLTR
ncbi:MAG: carboxy terminal-processing peptidase [Candidatus Polarisedimenticolaceae bacterium]|nr:carboxy terminal-processing peptidase [Candidatus Polarisedimenticolaceae bacterium]